MARINDRHAWLIKNGWQRMANVAICGRMQAQWMHERHGEKLFNTDRAEYNEIQEQLRRGELHQ
jgi:hypothetical protein